MKKHYLQELLLKSISNTLTLLTQTPVTQKLGGHLAILLSFTIYKSVADINLVFDEDSVLPVALILPLAFSSAAQLQLIRVYVSMKRERQKTQSRKPKLCIRVPKKLLLYEAVNFHS